MKKVYRQCVDLNHLGYRCTHGAITGSDKCRFHDVARRRRCLATSEKTGTTCMNMPLKGKNVCNLHIHEWKTYAGIVQEPEPLPEEAEGPFNPADIDPVLPFLGITDAKEFAKAILDSEIFRRYIVDGLVSRQIPQAVLLRLMDYADGWGKPPDKVEHTGKDGQPIETVTEVRMVVVKPELRQIPEETIDALPPINESRH